MSDFMSEQAEWDDLLASIPVETPSRQAVTRLGELLHDAVQAHRPWATDRLNAAVRVGLSHEWRRHTQSRRPKIETGGGSIKSVGGVRRDVGGESGFVQLPLDGMFREDLVQYKAMHLKYVRSSAATVRVVDRLIDALDRCPQATTPREAAELLGEDIDAVMAGAA